MFQTYCSYDKNTYLNIHLYLSSRQKQDAKMVLYGSMSKDAKWRTVAERKPPGGISKAAQRKETKSPGLLCLYIYWLPVPRYVFLSFQTHICISLSKYEQYFDIQISC